MNLKQVVADGAYTVFARMNTENKLKQIESVQYIKQLSITMEVDIENWDIMSLFGTGRGNTLYVDKREINKRFLAHTQKSEEQNLASGPNSIDPELARVHAEANVNIKRSLLDRINQLKNSKNRFLREATNYANQSNESLTRAFAEESAILALSKQEVDFAGQIKTIIDSGFWRYERFGDGKLYFKTTNDVSVRYIKKTANVDIRVNLGKFQTELDIRNGRLRVIGVENNTDVSGVTHPHVSNGNVCWGSASETYNNKMLAFDFVFVMQLLANLLSDYNDSNPYRSLYSFKAEQHMLVALKLLQEKKSGEFINKFFIDNQISDDDIENFWINRAPPAFRSNGQATLDALRNSSSTRTVTGDHIPSEEDYDLTDTEDWDDEVNPSAF